ncbi:MAG: hypothetical protein QM564_10530 [Bergeyella sp.]
MKKNLLFVFILIHGAVFAQEQKIFKIKKYQTAVLPDSVNETSGLTLFGGRLFTINDSGNLPDIFEIDKTSGKILNVFQTNTKNKDWEAITNDGTCFYVGDFGNNRGTRNDLEIYKIPFGVKDSAQIISYYYPEQKEFISKNINTDFDAEAMIYRNGKLHIFTKEWASKAVSHYIVNPEITEKQPALKTESFKTGFVVTDTAYFDGKLYVVGYTKGAEVFMMIFEESDPDVFFEKNPVKYCIGSSFKIGQIEGIAVDEEGIYISGEAFRSPLGEVRQSLYFIPHKKLIKR